MDKTIVGPEHVLLPVQGQEQCTNVRRRRQLHWHGDVEESVNRGPGASNSMKDIEIFVLSERLSVYIREGVVLSPPGPS